MVIFTNLLVGVKLLAANESIGISGLASGKYVATLPIGIG
jgi:hypothetical protein